MYENIVHLLTNVQRGVELHEGTKTAMKNSSYCH
jgi:hypothetical protein